MRRPLFMMPAPTALAALAAVAALGCEDGPTQTYSASPPDAGSIWNSGNVAPATTDAGQQFDAGYPVVSKTVLCDTDFKRQRWAWMLTQDISPPRKYAGIDLAKNDQWDGLTIGDAEAAPAARNSTTGGLCQSVPQGYEGHLPERHRLLQRELLGQQRGGQLLLERGHPPPRLHEPEPGVHGRDPDQRLPRRHRRHAQVDARHRRRGPP